MNRVLTSAAAVPFVAAAVVFGVIGLLVLIRWLIGVFSDVEKWGNSR